PAPVHPRRTRAARGAAVVPGAAVRDRAWLRRGEWRAQPPHPLAHSGAADLPRRAVVRKVRRRAVYAVGQPDRVVAAGDRPRIARAWGSPERRREGARPDLAGGHHHLCRLLVRARAAVLGRVPLGGDCRAGRARAVVVPDHSLAAVLPGSLGRGHHRRGCPGPARHAAGVRAAVSDRVVQRDRCGRARSVRALDPAIDARGAGPRPDRARRHSGCADSAGAKRADRLAADRRPGGGLDPALRRRLYRLPAAGSAGLIASRPYAITGPGQPRAAARAINQPAIFFQPARARVVTLSRFLATTSQFTMSGLAPAAETVSAT